MIKIVYLGVFTHIKNLKRALSNFGHFGLLAIFYGLATCTEAVNTEWSLIKDLIHPRAKDFKEGITHPGRRRLHIRKIMIVLLSQVVWALSCLVWATSGQTETPVGGLYLYLDTNTADEYYRKCVCRCVCV